MVGVSALACSGQGAPPTDKPVTPIAGSQVILVTPDAAIPSIVGAPCDDAHACGPELECDRTLPGGSCSTRCTPAGAACGTGTCVEQPAIDVCRAACRTTADCRADEGYVCDPVWRGCTLPNTATIAPLACPPPVGLGRDPMFAPATELAKRAPRSPAGVITDEGGLVILHETHDEPGLIEMARLDALGRALPSVRFPGRGAEPAIARDGATLLAVFANHRGTAKLMLATSPDRGASWNAPISLAESDCTRDRDCTSPMIVIGNDPARRGSAIVYVGYASGDGIRVRASRDGGKTFGAAITAVPGAKGKLATAADGTLF
ncbi:MAG: exo-alpha-sialidase, partial [Deltaproteobacteria bacterium]|nr:exo-alpha-sialidase [Deltaproteobacteria bacterium]